MNGGQFNGRCIIASDRNKHEAIKIKELVDTSPELTESVPSPITPIQYNVPVSPTQFSAPSRGQVRYLAPHKLMGLLRTDKGPFQEFYLGGYAQAYPFSYEGHDVAISAYSIPSSMTFAGADPTAYNTSDYYGEAYRSPQVAGTHDHYWEASLPYHGSTAWSNHDLGTVSQPADHGNYVQTERRKVLIRGIPSQARPEQVVAWVRKKLGPFAGKINAIEVPPSNSDSEIRGHAYVTLRSSSSAKEVVGILNQATFKGRQVSARLAVDGFTLIDDGAPGPQEARDSDRDKGLKKTRHSKHRETEATSSGSRHKSTSHKDAKSGKSDKRDKDEKDKSDPGPLVVDGSGRQKRSHR